jgi:hypothetical protein
MALIFTFLLGIANFAMHKAVLESRHPMLAQMPWMGLMGGRFSLALEFLLPRHQDRFRFRLSKVTAAQGTEIAEITFEERRRPTMIRTPEGDDVEARGTFWIDPVTGRVLKSELRTGDVNVVVDDHVVAH